MTGELSLEWFTALSSRSRIRDTMAPQSRKQVKGVDVYIYNKASTESNCLCWLILPQVGGGGGDDGGVPSKKKCRQLYENLLHHQTTGVASFREASSCPGATCSQRQARNKRCSCRNGCMVRRCLTVRSSVCSAPHFVPWCGACSLVQWNMYSRKKNRKVVQNAMAFKTPSSVCRDHVIIHTMKGHITWPKPTIGDTARSPVCPSGIFRAHTNATTLGSSAATPG